MVTETKGSSGMGKSLPPGVCGQVRGHLKLTVDEIFWIRKNDGGGVYAELQWWGDTVKYKFWPEDIQGMKRKLSGGALSITFDVRTNRALFEAYLRNCEKLEFHIFKSVTKERVGSAVLNDISRVFAENDFESYCPIFNGELVRLGDLHVSMKLIFEHNGITPRLKKNEENASSLKFKNQKEISRPVSAIIREEKIEDDRERVISDVVTRGNELRKAMMMSVLQDCAVKDIDAIVKNDHATREPVESARSKKMACMDARDEAKLIDYLLEKCPVIPPGITFTVEYAEPGEKTQHRPMVDKSKQYQFGSTKQYNAGDNVPRNGGEFSWVQLLKEVGSEMSFRVYWRHLNQRVGSLLGTTKVTRTIPPPPPHPSNQHRVHTHLSLPVVTNIGMVAARLNLYLEIGRDKRVFGHDLLGGKDLNKLHLFNGSLKRNATGQCIKAGPNRQNVVTGATQYYSNDQKEWSGQADGKGVSKSNPKAAIKNVHLDLGSCHLCIADPEDCTGEECLKRSANKQNYAERGASCYDEHICNIPWHNSAETIKKALPNGDNVLITYPCPMCGAKKPYVTSEIDSKHTNDNICKRAKRPPCSVCSSDREQGERKKSSAKLNTCANKRMYQIEDLPEDHDCYSDYESDTRDKESSGPQEFTSLDSVAGGEHRIVTHEITLSIDAVMDCPFFIHGRNRDDVDCFVTYHFPSIGKGPGSTSDKCSTEVMPGSDEINFSNVFRHIFGISEVKTLAMVLNTCSRADSCGDFTSNCTAGVVLKLWARSYEPHPLNKLIATALLPFSKLFSMEMKFDKQTGTRSTVRETVGLPLRLVPSSFTNDYEGTTGQVRLTLTYKNYLDPRLKKGGGTEDLSTDPLDSFNSDQHNHKGTYNGKNTSPEYDTGSLHKFNNKLKEVPRSSSSSYSCDKLDSKTHPSGRKLNEGDNLDFKPLECIRNSSNGFERHSSLEFAEVQGENLATCSVDEPTKLKRTFSKDHLPCDSEGSKNIKSGDRISRVSSNGMKNDLESLQLRHDLGEYSYIERMPDFDSSTKCRFKDQLSNSAYNDELLFNVDKNLPNVTCRMKDSKLLPEHDRLKNGSENDRKIIEAIDNNVINNVVLEDNEQCFGQSKTTHQTRVENIIIDSDKAIGPNKKMDRILLDSTASRKVDSFEQDHKNTLGYSIPVRFENCGKVSSDDDIRRVERGTNIIHDSEVKSGQDTEWNCTRFNKTNGVSGGSIHESHTNGVHSEKLFEHTSLETTSEIGDNERCKRGGTFADAEMRLPFCSEILDDCQFDDKSTQTSNSLRFRGGKLEAEKLKCSRAVNTDFNYDVTETDAIISTESISLEDKAKEVFKARVEIERAFNLPMVETEGRNKEETLVKPSTYVSFEAYIDGKTLSEVKTRVVPFDTNPVWDCFWEVWLPAELLYKCDCTLKFAVLEASTSALPVDLSSVRKCLADVDLTVLSAGLPFLCGWFCLSNYSRSCGQIKISITPLEDIAQHRVKWLKEYSLNHHKVGTCSQLSTSSKSSELYLAQGLYDRLPTVIPGDSHVYNHLSQIDFVGRQATKGQIPIPVQSNKHVDGDKITNSFLALSLKEKLTELDELTKSLKRKMKINKKSLREETCEPTVPHRCPSSNRNFEEIIERIGDPEQRNRRSGIHAGGEVGHVELDLECCKADLFKKLLQIPEVDRVLEDCVDSLEDSTSQQGAHVCPQVGDCCHSLDQATQSKETLNSMLKASPCQPTTMPTFRKEPDGGSPELDHVSNIALYNQVTFL
ncbi:hypothetical protein AAG570_005598 [Ranatra chinensis]|uniref:C2CD3 N-terminal C2 domain-containing protein n=1 Tax=Ranatra chinensis TaxID=642074 RepID=A0ABD0YAR2_9HEMI